MNNILEKQVTIIGAGLTGLTLGFLLKRRNIDFVIVEKESRAGGVINTKQHDGFTYETGPNTGIIAHPEVVELFEMLAPECEIELADPKAENRWILKNGNGKTSPRD
jgi:protoporphyrinogen/coproporphyrinogen III oxidase